MSMQHRFKVYSTKVKTYYPGEKMFGQIHAYDFHEI